MDNIPILPALFLVFAGMAVGIACFYRNRSDEEAARKRLKKTNHDLQRSLKTSQVALDSLDEKYSRQRGQLNVLQQLCDDWSSSRETAERERVQLEADVSAKSTRAAEIEKDYQSEKQKRIELEDQLHELTQEKIAASAAVEKQWRTKHSKSESLLAQRNNDLASARGEKERLSEQLHAAQAEIAELKSEIDSSKILIETATCNASGLKQEYVSLESAMQASGEQLKSLQSEIAAAKSEKEVAQQSVSELDKRYAVLEKECDSLRSQLSDRDSLAQQVDTAKASLSANAEQLARVSLQRDQALATEKTFATLTAGLQKRIDNQESTIHMLRQNQDDALENLKHELKVRSEIEAKFDSRMKALRDENEAAKTKFEQQLESLSTETGNAKSQIKTDYETQLDALRTQLGRQSSQYAEHSKDLREQLSLQRTEFDQERQRLTVESESLVSRMDAAKTELNARIAELESEANTYTQSIVKLDTQREQLQQELQLAQTQMKSQLKQDSETIGELQRERNDLREDIDILQARIAELQQENDRHNDYSGELAEAHGRVRDLETELNRRAEDAKRYQAQTVELSRLRQQHHDSKTRQESLQCQLDELLARQLKRDTERTDLAATVRELQAKLNVNEETIVDLRKERAMVLASLADQRQSHSPESTVISFTQSLEKDEQYDSEYGGKTKRHANRGVVYTEAPESCDDLKRISGIAEILEKRLNDFGIYTFRQVMEWKAEEIEEFSRLLAFRDRIDRDDWQGQARFFYNQKRKSVPAAA